MPCEYFEKTLINLLYKPEYLGTISLTKLRSIFSYMSPQDLDRCIEELLKSGRGWEIREGYLVNQIIVKEVLYEEKARIEHQLNEVEKRINDLREQVDVVREVRRIYVENPLLRGEWAPTIKIYVYTIWTEKLSTILEELDKKEKQSKHLKRILEEMELKMKTSLR